MIKLDTIGMLDVAKVNPILKSEEDVANYSFKTFDNDLYLISNTIVGDDSYREDVVIPAGECLNGWLVKAWESQKLVVDAKHIATAYNSLTAGTTVLVANSDGKLEAGSAPSKGVYFKVVEKTRLTEAAVKVKVVVA